MTTQWLPGATVHDLHPGIGNGPFGIDGRTFLGVILHVNVSENGTPASFWGNGNPGQVCPNFQVFKDGSIDQMLPLNWSPWCQIDGNFNYAAIETAGMPNEPLTAAQLEACARIVRAYRDVLGMELRVADQPGQRGLGTHEMGGAAWGGHVCPGAIRTAQRREIIALAEGDPMPTVDEIWSHKFSDGETAEFTLKQAQNRADKAATNAFAAKASVAELDARVAALQAAVATLTAAGGTVTVSGGVLHLTGDVKVSPK